MSAMPEVAMRFFDLAQKHQHWVDVTDLPSDERQILFDMVTAAGFEPGGVAPGKLLGDYRDQDGSRTGETFPINHLCPMKVIDQSGRDDYFATGWLDCVLRQLVHDAVFRTEDREELIAIVAREIERSVPLIPIQLTADGDLLREYPPRPHAFGLEYLVDHTRDTHNLGSCVGVHACCNGYVDRRGATSTSDALVCRSCHMRVLFPKHVATYGELRQALAAFFAAVSA